MDFQETELHGAWIIHPERHADSRGHFARTFCEEEFGKRNLCAHWPQWSVSYNAKRGTLRGLHFQASPGEEIKIVRCERGAVYDVIVDLRPNSPTFEQWTAVDLSEENGRAVYVPKGFAHGYQTVAEGAQLCYHISEPFVPSLARGIRWNDPVLGITWPISNPTLSSRDNDLPTLRDLRW